MSDLDPPIRRPGPWDPKPEDLTVSRGDTSPAAVSEPPLDKGQHPVVAIGGTLLFFAFIWFVTQSWVMAVALIWGLFVHEYGHVLAMNQVGMGPARIYVIPFLGGLAKGQRAPVSEWHGVLVSLAGPAFGLLAAIPFFGLYFATGGGAWLLGAAVIAAINLINLAPAPPLDGSKAIGPVLARIHPMVEKAALILVGVAVVYWGFMTGRWILGAFLIIALIGHLRRGTWRPFGRDLTVREAFASVGLFLLTAAACVGVALAALMPLAEGSLPDALEIAGHYLGFPS